MRQVGVSAGEYAHDSRLGRAPPPDHRNAPWDSSGLVGPVYLDVERVVTENESFAVIEKQPIALRQAG